LNASLYGGSISAQLKTSIIPKKFIGWFLEFFGHSSSPEYALIMRCFQAAFFLVSGAMPHYRTSIHTPMLTKG
jgi:hypothetical protein